MSHVEHQKQAELFGHPTGLFTLFFDEVWERLSFHGMRALLLFYMIKGFLGFADRDANAVYGAYTALVYMTPFFGDVVAAFWLLLMYPLMTTGELCPSPVGLSMVTQLSLGRLVSTAMGAWFLATAFSQFLAAIIAQFAAVNEVGEKLVPIPLETVHIYGRVYGMIALTAIGSGLLCLALVPLLKRWMHLEEIPSQ